MGHPEQAALYVTMRNHGCGPEAVLAVSSTVAMTGDSHQTVLQDGTMVMHPQTRFAMPPGAWRCVWEAST